MNKENTIYLRKKSKNIVGHCNACLAEDSHEYDKVYEIFINRVSFRVCEKHKDQLIKLLKE